MEWNINTAKCTICGETWGLHCNEKCQDSKNVFLPDHPEIEITKNTICKCSNPLSDHRSHMFCDTSYSGKFSPSLKEKLKKKYLLTNELFDL